MKQQILALFAKLDAMSLRERIMMFAAAAIVLVALVNTLVWTPLQAKQKRLGVAQRQIQGEIVSTQLESEQKLKAFAVDPDQANRQRQQNLLRQRDQLTRHLTQQQKDLVPAEKMAELLENVLKQHPRLHLISLRTINNGAPPGLAQKAAAPEAAAAAKLPAPGSPESEGPLFRHGVQVIIEGSYPDLLDYAQALENLPWQLYWGDLQLDVQTWPKAYLSFELYTLSLDRKWMNL